MPNGYLLYNFAATFLVDFTYRETRNYLFWHMILINPAFMTCIVAFFIAGAEDSESWLVGNLQDNSIILSENVQLFMNISLLILGFLSLIMCLVHWFVSIKRLYVPPEEIEEVGETVPNNPEDEEEPQEIQ